MATPVQSVFATPELFEKVMLALHRKSYDVEVDTIRTIRRYQRVCKAWNDNILSSTPIRRALFLPSPDSGPRYTAAWETATPMPVARPNPWLAEIISGTSGWNVFGEFEREDEDADYDPLYPMKPTKARPNIYDEDDFDSDAEPDLELAAKYPRRWRLQHKMMTDLLPDLPKTGGWMKMLLSDPPTRHLKVETESYTMSGNICYYTKSFEGDQDGFVSMGGLARGIAQTIGKKKNTEFAHYSSW